MALAMPSPRKNQRPTSARRTPMSRTLRLVSRKRAISWRWRPKVLTSSAPLMPSVSVMMLLMSALYSRAWRRMRRRMPPTRRAGSRNSGSTTTDSRASRHSMEIITASVETRVMPLVDDVGQGAGHGALGADHVVVKARHDLARLGVGEKAQRHALQVIVHRLAQVADDALADAGAEVALRHADQPADDGDADHAQGQQVQPRHIPVRQHVVDQVAVQQGRYQPDERGDADGRQHQCQRAPVGPGIAQHPAQELPADLGLGPSIRRTA